MSTAFVPPKLSDHQGPDDSFTPPLLSDHQGPDTGAAHLPPSVSIPLYNSQGQIRPQGLDVPMGTGATIATAPLRVSGGGAEQMGQGFTRVGAAHDKGEVFGGVSDVMRGYLQMMSVPWMASSVLAPVVEGVGGLVQRLTQGGLRQAPRTIAAVPGQVARTVVGAAPTVAGAAAGLGVGVATGATTEQLLKWAGTKEGTAELAGTLTGLGTGIAAQKAIGGISSWTLELLKRANSSEEFKTALLKEVPLIGPKWGRLKTAWDKYQKAQNPEPQAPKPFKPNDATARKMEFGGPPPPAHNPPGRNIPRGRWSPAEVPPPPEPQAPDPFKPKDSIRRKMKFGGPTEQDYGASSAPEATGWTAPTEPLYPQSSEPINRYTPEPRPPGERSMMSDRAKSKMRFGGPTRNTGTRGKNEPAKRRGINRALLPPPEAEGEGEGATETDGVILTPAMQEALVQAELAKRGLPSKMTPMPKEEAAPQGNTGTTPPPGSITFGPKAGRPARYGALQSTAAEQAGEMYHKRDLRAMQELQKKGITKESWQTLTHDQKNAYLKAAGQREFKGEPTGFSRGEKGMQWLDAMWDDQ